MVIIVFTCSYPFSNMVSINLSSPGSTLIRDAFIVSPGWGEIYWVIWPTVQNLRIRRNQKIWKVTAILRAGISNLLSSCFQLPLCSAAFSCCQLTFPTIPYWNQNLSSFQLTFTETNSPQYQTLHQRETCSSLSKHGSGLLWRLTRNEWQVA